MNDIQTFYINKRRYDIAINDLPPYLKNYLSFEEAKSNSDLRDGVCTLNKDIPLFDVAMKGLQQGYRHIFRSLGSDDLDAYHTICATYDFLGVDITPRHLDKAELDVVITGVKAGRPRPEDNPHAWRSGLGNKSKSRDAAFELLHILLVGEIAENLSNKIYYAVYFIFSHPGIFKRATRETIRKAFEDRFVASIRQKKSLDEWARGYHCDDYSDGTTSEEFAEDLGSDME